MPESGTFCPGRTVGLFGMFQSSLLYGIVYIMPNRSSKKKRPADTNKLAFNIVQESTGSNDPYPISHKNKAAVELGKLGGKKGGKARAANMTKKQRSEAARRAANARWKNHKNDGA